MNKIFGVILVLIIFYATAFGQEKSSYEKLIDTAMAEFGTKASHLNDEYKLGNYERWDMLQDTGKLVFSDNGTSKVIATVQILGSYSTYSGTWMWSWANDSVSNLNKQDIGKIKDYGEKNQFKELTTAQWKCPENYGWTLTSVAGYLLKAKGAYRGDIPDGIVYFIITDIKWADKRK